MLELLGEQNSVLLENDAKIVFLRLPLSANICIYR